MLSGGQPRREKKARGEQACGDATRGAEGAMGVLWTTVESGVFAVVSEGGGEEEETRSRMVAMEQRRKG